VGDDAISVDVGDDDGRIGGNQLDLNYLDGMSGQTYPSNLISKTQRNYEWNAVGGEWWLELYISDSLVGYYEERPRPWRTEANPHWGSFVRDPYDDEQIKFIANEFEALGADNGLSEREVVNLAMRFVQQLQYTPDDVSTGYDQYARYPVETLHHRGGDCVDTSVLLAAILQEMGYGCVLLALWDANHMAVGVKGDPSITGSYYEYNNNRYYYVETTGSGWSVGEIPPNFGETSAEIQAIEPEPTLVHAWETNTRGSEVDVIVTVENVGQRTAQSVRLRAGFENQFGITHAEAYTDISSLHRGGATTEVLTLEPSDERTFRLNTRLSIWGDVYDSDESDLRHPV